VQTSGWTALGWVEGYRLICKPPIWVGLYRRLIAPTLKHIAQRDRGHHRRAVVEQGVEGSDGLLGSVEGGQTLRLVIPPKGCIFVVDSGAEHQMAMAVQPRKAREKCGAFGEGGVGGFVPFEAEHLDPAMVVATDQAARQKLPVNDKSEETEQESVLDGAHPEDTHQQVEPRQSQRFEESTARHGARAGHGLFAVGRGPRGQEVDDFAGQFDVAIAQNMAHLVGVVHPHRGRGWRRTVVEQASGWLHRVGG
jgi:hypothetical protein